MSFDVERHQEYKDRVAKNDVYPIKVKYCSHCGAIMDLYS